MKIQNIGSEGSHWMDLSDLALTSGNERCLLDSRGNTRCGHSSQMNTIFDPSAVYHGPLLAELAIVCGYFVTGKALKPVEGRGAGK